MIFTKSSLFLFWLKPLKIILPPIFFFSLPFNLSPSPALLRFLLLLFLLLPLLLRFSSAGGGVIRLTVTAGSASAPLPGGAAGPEWWWGVKNPPDQAVRGVKRERERLAGRKKWRRVRAQARVKGWPRGGQTLWEGGSCRWRGAPPRGFPSFTSGTGGRGGSGVAAARTPSRKIFR